MAHKRTPLGLLIGAAVTAATALSVGLLYYLKSGTGETNAALIPTSLEQRLDRVVEALNRRFGKQWVEQALSTLKVGLERTLPAPLVALVEVVHGVEQIGQKNGWSGLQKRYEAVVQSQS